MARRHDDDPSESRPLSRRDLIRYAGGIALSSPLIGAGAAASSDSEYETVTVPEGEIAEFSVGDGETLENLLVDITAPRADVAIRASGDDWTVRDVGIRGQSERGRSDVQWAMLWADGNGTVENVYLGDGCVSGVDRTGIAARAQAHAGHFEVRNCYVAGWSDNGIYAAHAANHSQGTVRLEDCYFRDNNVSHFRLACDGDEVVGCVAHNTGHVPALPDGAVWSRGVFTYYGAPTNRITVEDCHVDVTDQNTNGTAHAFVGHSAGEGESATVHVENTEYRGDTYGPSVELGAGNGDDPDLTPPDGVPEAPETAARGARSGADHDN